jgi:hypothetical protein
MSLNLTTLLPAKINTSEIATKYDVSSSIAAYNPATAINANTTTIDGGKITTGTITTNQLTTGIALINGEVKSSDFTTIGGAGFRLKANAAGTSADPTIYGAYIKGAYLNGSFADISSMKIAASGFPNNYGKSRYVNTLYHSGTTYSTTTTLNTFLVYGPAYGSGLEPKRVCDITQSIVELSVTFARPGSSSYIDIQRSVDGAGYTTVATSTTGYNVPFTYYFIDSLLPSGFSTCQYRYTIYTGSGNVVLWTSRLTIDNI